MSLILHSVEVITQGLKDFSENRNTTFFSLMKMNTTKPSSDLEIIENAKRVKANFSLERLSIKYGVDAVKAAYDGMKTPTTALL